MSGRAIAVIIAGFLTVFTAYAIRYGYGMLLPEMLHALSISKTEAGVIYSAYFIAYTVFSPLLGLMADRFDIRVLLTLFVGILGIGALLMSFATSVINASFFFLLAGIGHSACWVPVVALVQRWVSDRRRGMALAFTDLGSATGIAVWSVSIPYIVGSYGWRAGWVTLGILAFLVAGMNFMLVRNSPDDRSTRKAPSPGGPVREPIRATYKKLLHDGKLWLIGLSYLLISFSVLIHLTFLSTYAKQELMLPYEAATRLITVIAIFGVVGKLILGPLSDAFGRVRIMMGCDALVAAGSLGIAYSERLLTVGLSTAVVGLGYGAIWAVYAASASDFFSKKYAGSVVGLWTMYLGVGSILSPTVAGWTIDATGTYTWAFVLAMGAATLSLLLLLPLIKASPGSSSGAE